MTLEQFFKENKSIALAFSGGTDSAFLLSQAVKYADKVCAFYVKSAFQPQFELDDAKKLAKQTGAEFYIIDADVLCDEMVVTNPSDRCYYCKKIIFENIIRFAREHGCETVIDGTNASDDISDRPGFKALCELGVRSPLRECSLSKSDIRQMSKQINLFTWDKPAYACLATRIPCGERITAEKLIKIEKAENYLFSLGFTDFRVRTSENTAKIQLPSSQHKKAEAMLDTIKSKLGEYYDSIILDKEIIR